MTRQQIISEDRLAEAASNAIKEHRSALTRMLQADEYYGGSSDPNAVRIMSNADHGVTASRTVVKDAFRALFGGRAAAAQKRLDAEALAIMSDANVAAPQATPATSEEKEAFDFMSTKAS